MRIFLDANIIISVLNKEYPVFTFSSRILSLADSKHHKIYTSPVCLAIAFYFAEKKFKPKVAKEKIELLSKHIYITSVDGETVLKALQDIKVMDFEDGLEYYSAITSKCKCIVTEDVKDFHFAGIEVLDSESFCRKYMTRSK